MVPANRRPSDYGLFTGAYGLAWFLGSAAIGILYEYSIAAAVVFSLVAQLLALPLLIKVGRRGSTNVRHDNLVS
jgi:hypothetical protein